MRGMGWWYYSNMVALFFFVFLVLLYTRAHTQFHLRFVGKHPNQRNS